MKTYKPGVTRKVTCDFCDAGYWAAVRVGAGVGWECAVCGDVDARHPVIAEKDRTEEDL